MVRPRRSSKAEATDVRHALRHVLVVGGTTDEWVTFGEEAWRERVAGFGATVAEFGVPWLTLRPYEGDLSATGGDGATGADTSLRADLVAATGGRNEPGGVVAEVGDVTVLVGLDADGRRRIAVAISDLAASHISPDDVDEERMVQALLAPSGAEPDLVVILGRPDRLPPSLVWELAYAEIVYLDLPWADLDATHLLLAVDDFRRRDRRFGGIDA